MQRWFIVRQDLEAFFWDKAYAYTKGRLRHVALLFHYPCEFRVGSQVLHMVGPQDVENLFETYRNNLLKEDYDQTRAELVHVSEADGGHMYCLVTYRNTDVSGKAISTEHACYFLRRSTDGLFQITLVEFVDEPNPDLLKGLELSPALREGF